MHFIEVKLNIEYAFAKSKEFFEMSESSKLSYAKDTSKGFHGWARPNQEKLRPDSLYEFRESFDFYKGRIFYSGEEVEEFQMSMSELEVKSKELIVRLLGVLAKSLQLDRDFFLEKHSNLFDPSVPSFTTFRALYYPSIPPSILSEAESGRGAVRCGEHSDYGMLTLLFQDKIPGLEVKTVGDKWIPANPIDGAILVNTGDLLQQWSGGYFPATEHRVQLPASEVMRNTSRQSIVYFVHPDDDVLISPLKASDEKFEPVTAYQHAKRKLDKTYT